MIEHAAGLQTNYCVSCDRAARGIDEASSNCAAHGYGCPPFENGLYLDDERAQEVDISKTFHYDYWNNLCPFDYNDRLIDSAVVPAIREKYGSEYTEFALRQPDLKDYGSFIALRFYKSAAGPNHENEFAMHVDRCTKKVTRTREVPAEALRDQPP